MTADQLLLLHRIMQMSDVEFAKLRENYMLYLGAIDKIRGVVGLQTNAQCVASLNQLHDEIAAA